MNSSDISGKLGCVLLAAGGSRRLGQPKQWVQYKGEPIVSRATHNLLELGVGPVLVVGGSNFPKLQKLLGKYPVEAVINDHWKQGMGQSISTGVNHLPTGLSGVLIALCDQWMVTKDDLDALVKSWLSDISVISVSKWGKLQKGGYGPPVIFPERLFSELKALKGDRGARPVIRTHLDQVKFVEMKNAGHDLDVPEDLKKLRQIDRKLPL